MLTTCQRWFVIHNRPEPAVSMTIIRQEVEYTQTKLLNIHLNESAWNYLRGLSEKYNDNESASVGSMITKFCYLMLQHDEVIQDKDKSKGDGNVEEDEESEYEDIDDIDDEGNIHPNIADTSHSTNTKTEDEEENEKDHNMANRTRQVWNPFALSLLADIK